jgi:hypothetical protein
MRTALLLLLVLAACSASDAGSGGRSGRGGSAGAGNGDESGGSGGGPGTIPGGGNPASGGSGPGPGAGLRDGGVGADACATVVGEGEEVSRPVDVILIVDSSDSMAMARQTISQIIDTEFASIIEAAKVDYRVIALHGGVLVIGPPLSTSGRYHELNDLTIGSGDGVAFVHVLDRYPEWSPWLREDAFKVFMHFTDGTSGNGETITGYTGRFDEELVRLDPAQFGDADDLQFTYHAIAGFKENVPPDLPYAPGDPVVTVGCQHPSFGLGIQGASEGFQGVAIRTDGLRHSVCQFDHYDAVFNTIADGVVSKSIVPCSFAIPDPPSGKEYYLSGGVSVELSDASGSVAAFARVADATACAPESFYLDGDQVELCPAACDTAKATEGARVDVAFDCDAIIDLE